MNAFLALDVDIDTDDVDAVTQSIEYARCSNATAFIVPFLGHNFGVGEEAGSILENLADTHGERLIFVSRTAGRSRSSRLVTASPALTGGSRPVGRPHGISADAAVTASWGS